MAALERCWECFSDLPTPSGGDWLAKGQPGEKDRLGQPMKTFTRPGPHRTFPSARQKKILLVPIGDVEGAPPPEVLIESLAATYHGLEVAVAPKKLLPKKEREALSCEDYGSEYGPQYLTNEIHDLLTKHKPRDAFVVVGYTMCDITKADRYPSGEVEVWNFVFGEACVDKGTGIFSFARYRDGAGATDPVVFTRRCCMVLNHEVGHLFGIKHCIYAKCLMNGCNTLEESEDRPFALCPVDLAKVCDTLTQSKLMPAARGARRQRNAFLAEREARLLAFFESMGMEEDAALATQRLALIRSGEDGDVEGMAAVGSEPNPARSTRPTGI